MGLQASECPQRGPRVALSCIDNLVVIWSDHCYEGGEGGMDTDHTFHFFSAQFSDAIALSSCESFDR